jgi:hypothetical protein
MNIPRGWDVISPLPAKYVSIFFTQCIIHITALYGSKSLLHNTPTTNALIVLPALTNTFPKLRRQSWRPSSLIYDCGTDYIWLGWSPRPITQLATGMDYTLTRVSQVHDVHLITTFIRAPYVWFCSTLSERKLKISKLLLVFVTCHATTVLAWSRHWLLSTT